MGFYVGCGPASCEEVSGGVNSIIAVPAFRWGVGAHWHLLSAIGAETRCWDISLNGTLGSYWGLQSQPQAEYAASMSVAYYPLQHWGISVESGWGKFVFNRSNDAFLSKGNTILKAGIGY